MHNHTHFGTQTAYTSKLTKEDFYCLLKCDLENIDEYLNEAKIIALSKVQYKMHIKKLLNQVFFSDIKVL